MIWIIIYLLPGITMTLLTPSRGWYADLLFTTLWPLYVYWEFFTNDE